MKKRIFLADKDGTVEALGVMLDAKPEEVHLLVNGSDLSETLMLERIEIYIDKPSVQTKLTIEAKKGK